MDYHSSNLLSRGFGVAKPNNFSMVINRRGGEVRPDDPNLTDKDLELISAFTTNCRNQMPIVITTTYCEQLALSKLYKMKEIKQCEATSCSDDVTGDDELKVMDCKFRCVAKVHGVKQIEYEKYAQLRDYIHDCQAEIFPYKVTENSELTIKQCVVKLQPKLSLEKLQTFFQCTYFDCLTKDRNNFIQCNMECTKPIIDLIDVANSIPEPKGNDANHPEGEKSGPHKDDCDQAKPSLAIQTSPLFKINYQVVIALAAFKLFEIATYQ